MGINRSCWTVETESFIFAKFTATISGIQILGDKLQSQIRLIYKFQKPIHDNYLYIVSAEHCNKYFRLCSKCRKIIRHSILALASQLNW